MISSTVLSKETHPLDGNALMMELRSYEDGTWRADVVFCDRGMRTTVLVQKRPSRELVVAAIARDFATYAALALATLPTVGRMHDEAGEVVPL